jgi:putative hydrolase of the HAD superfamily
LGLWDFFDVICTADDVKKVKPDPGLFLLAAKRLGLEPGETVVFEDSPKGIQAAKAAGCYCVAVPHKLSNLNGQAGADLVIQSMADTALPDLLNDINQLL